MTDQKNKSSEPSIEPSIWGHPKGLFYLFFAELWERFSFYGMRALLTLYMVNKVFESLATRDATSAAIYASYGSLVYAFAVMGGKIADTMLGFRRSIILGGILMAIGQFVLAFHENENAVFFMGLAFIIVGNGFFKPNISSFVGTLYPPNDKRKDSGFTIFYMGINIGGFIAPLICGWLAREYGWGWGFSSAGFGMILGLLVFYSGGKNGIFGDKGLPPDENRLNNRVMGLKIKTIIPLSALILVPIIALSISLYNPISGGESIIGDSNLVNLLFQIFGILIAIYLVYILWSCTVDERKKLIVALFLTVFMTIFWGFGELSGSIITLFADRNVNLGFINAAQSNAIWPLFVIILALPVSYLWTIMSKHKINPYTPYKFVIGMTFMGIAFMVLSMSKGFADQHGNVSILFLFALYLLITIGELFMSPVGLSKITDLSPGRYMAFMMGVWFLSSAYAFQIVGFIGKKLAIEGEGNGILVSGWDTLGIYTDGFSLIAKYAIGASVFMLILAPILKKWMGNVH
ncbi:peptide MFS transporter [Bacteroidota bacterium]